MTPARYPCGQFITARARRSAVIGLLAVLEIPLVPIEDARHIPADVKREVYLRDGGQCTYVDGHGHRLRETRHRRKAGSGERPETARGERVQEGGDECDAAPHAHLHEWTLATARPDESALGQTSGAGSSQACTSDTTDAPAPLAEATRFIEPERMSPAA